MICTCGGYEIFRFSSLGTVNNERPYVAEGCAVTLDRPLLKDILATFSFLFCSVPSSSEAWHKSTSPNDLLRPAQMRSLRGGDCATGVAGRMPEYRVPKFVPSSVRPSVPVSNTACEFGGQIWRIPISFPVYRPTRNKLLKFSLVSKITCSRIIHQILSTSHPVSVLLEMYVKRVCLQLLVCSVRVV